MRRGRVIVAVPAILAALFAAAATASGASAAASPQEVCADLADGKIDGNWSQEELASATVQGYCSLIVIVTPPSSQPPPPPPPQPPTTASVCTEVQAGTTGAVQAPNGKWYVGGDNPAMCGPAAPVPTPQAPGAPTPPAAEAQSEAPASQPVGQVLPGEKTIVVNQPSPEAQPAVREGVAGQQSPLRRTRTTGTLPFTGAELAIFAIVGAALVGAGLLLRTSSRQKADPS